jgi:hypothetical protein
MELAVQLLAQAKSGDLAAVKLLFVYAIGRPTEAVDPDTLDLEEWQLFQRTPAPVEDVRKVVNGLSSHLACILLRGIVPAMQDHRLSSWSQQLEDSLNKERRENPGEAADGNSAADITAPV